MTARGVASGRAARLACRLSIPLLAVVCLAAAAVAQGPLPPAGGTRGPQELAFSRDGKWAYVPEQDAHDVAVIDVERGVVAGHIPSGGQEPVSLAVVADGRTLLVANSFSDSLAWIDLEARKLAATLDLRGMPWDVVVSPDGRRAFVSLSQLDQVAVIDLAERKEVGRIGVGRRPQPLALTADGRKLACGNNQSGTVAVIDTGTLKVERWLRTRGVNLRGLAVVTAADFGIPSERAFVVASVTVPNRNRQALNPLGGQIWANFIDVLPLEGRPKAVSLGPSRPGESGKRAVESDVAGKIWLDPAREVARQGRQAISGRHYDFALAPIAGQPNQRQFVVTQSRAFEAAADPCQIALVPELDVAFVANGGIRSVSAFSLAHVVQGECGPPGAEPPAGRSGPAQGVGPGRRVLPRRTVAHSSFWAPFAQGGFRPGVIRQEVGINPRALALTPDRERLWVANHLGNSISVLTLDGMQVERTIDLGKPEGLDGGWAGRVIFNDAFASKEQWFSCATCHPDGMADGRSWQFAHVSDEFPEFRNTRLLRGGIHQTAPFRWSGHDEALEVFVQDEVTGLLKGKARTEMELRSLSVFLGGLKLPPNPYRTPSDALTPAAEEGRALFAGKAGCLGCHNGPLQGGTGQKAWIGTRPEGKPVDVPHLAGVASSAPYLHDGRAHTLEGVLRQHNAGGTHGKAHELTDAEMGALLEYVRQL